MQKRTICNKSVDILLQVDMRMCLHDSLTVMSTKSFVSCQQTCSGVDSTLVLRRTQLHTAFSQNILHGIHPGTCFKEVVKTQNFLSTHLLQLNELG